MSATSQQLEIEGIGQQKATLSQWKIDNSVFTHHSPHLEGNGFTWSCWGESSDPEQFLSKYGDNSFGFGNSEKSAILSFCNKHNIEIPFWWR